MPSAALGADFAGPGRPRRSSCRCGRWRADGYRSADWDGYPVGVRRDSDLECGEVRPRWRQPSECCPPSRPPLIADTRIQREALGLGQERRAVRPSATSVLLSLGRRRGLYALKDLGWQNGPRGGAVWRGEIAEEPVRLFWPAKGDGLNASPASGGCGLYG